MPKKKINVEEPLDKAIYDALLSESDRGAVLLGAALIEESLKKLLRQFMIEDSDIENHLSNQSASTLNKLAYGLGLTSKQELEDIDKIQKVRNQFAHELLRVKFENDDIKDFCSKLTTPDDFMTNAIELAPRSRFTVAVVALSVILEQRREEARRQQRRRANPALKSSISIG